MIRAKSTLALSLAALLGLAACDEGPRTQAGAGIGAALGGMFGLTRPGGGSGVKAATGAVIGGVIGGAIGQALDKQAGDLRQAIGNDNIGIVNTGSSLIVTMPNDILFATDSSVVSASLRSDLGALAGNLKDYPNSLVEVIGHTDNTGTAAYNLSLSQRRAGAVASVLYGNGIASSRVVAVGKGEDEPAASNLTVDGRAQNRRVEIVIRPTA